jgi:hypothetical protein
MKRVLLVGVAIALAGLSLSCGGNSTLDDTEAVVVLSIEIEQYNPDIDVCSQTQLGIDVSIDDMSIASNPKDPGSDLTSNQDVNLTRWVIRPYRTDGGSEASPEWSYDLTVYIPANGTTQLNNYRIYPVEYLTDPPLSHLFPENGGFDPETGNRNIRQSMELEIFGRTVSGKAVSTIPIPVAFNFFCGSP